MWVGMNLARYNRGGHCRHWVGAPERFNVLQVGQSWTMKIGPPKYQNHHAEETPHSPLPLLGQWGNQGLSWLAAGSILQPRLLCPESSSYSVTTCKKVNKEAWHHVTHLVYSRNKTSCLCLNSIALFPAYFPSSCTRTRLSSSQTAAGALTSTRIPSKCQMGSFFSLDLGLLHLEEALIERTWA